MSDHRTAPEVDPAAPASLAKSPGAGLAVRDLLPATVLSEDTRIAVEIRELVGRGAADAARERFAALLAIHQRRAMRIAYQYLRDAADADEVVQDAFLKAYSHIDSYREAWPFEVWFTRILINGCLDRRKARLRRTRWFSQPTGQFVEEAQPALTSAALDPEARLLARERRAKLAAAIERLDGRQRTIFMLTHYGDCSPREVSAMTGLKESTVRVHLFRAARKLRGLLGGRS